MLIPVDGWAAGIKAYLGLLDWFEGLFFSRESVVELYLLHVWSRKEGLLSLFVWSGDICFYTDF